MQLLHSWHFTLPSVAIAINKSGFTVKLIKSHSVSQVPAKALYSTRFVFFLKRDSSNVQVLGPTKYESIPSDQPHFTDEKD